jgi:hypothetical protein
VLQQKFFTNVEQKEIKKVRLDSLSWANCLHFLLSLAYSHGFVVYQTGDTNLH